MILQISKTNKALVNFTILSRFVLKLVFHFLTPLWRLKTFCEKKGLLKSYVALRKALVILFNLVADVSKSILKVQEYWFLNSVNFSSFQCCTCQVVSNFQTLCSSSSKVFPAVSDTDAQNIIKEKLSKFNGSELRRPSNIILFIKYSENPHERINFFLGLAKQVLIFWCISWQFRRNKVLIRFSFFMRETQLSTWVSSLTIL